MNNVQQQEDANFAACASAYNAEHEADGNHENCNDGDMGCSGCPFGMTEARRDALATKYANERIAHAAAFYAAHGVRNYYQLLPQHQAEFNKLDAAIQKKYDDLYVGDRVQGVMELIEEDLDEDGIAALREALAKKYPTQFAGKGSCIFCKGDDNDPKGWYCKTCGAC